jgi:hypothetical protein
VDAGEIRLGDHLDIVCAAAAHPAVGDADDRNATGRRLFDRRPGRMVHDEHADIVAAVVECRDIGFAENTHRSARALEAPVLGNVEDLRQPRIFVAA